MIEAIFRSSKHNFLFKKNLDSEDSLRKHVDFYFQEHNTRIPHNSFSGATPLEVYTDQWTTEDDLKLKEEIKQARTERIKYHRNLNCKKCS